MLEKSRLVCLLAILALLLGGPVSGLLAQEGSHEEGHKHGQQAQLVGCLEEGDEAGYYLLTDEDGEEYDVTGIADLKKHLGHKVRLTGSWEEEGESRIFKATKIEHLSADCDS